MTLRTKTVKISGVPSERGWSQSFEYLSEDGQKTNKPLLFIVFSTIRKNSEFDDAILGREILSQFRDEYFSDDKKLPNLSLKDAVNKIFNEFFQKLDGLEIAAGSFVDGTFYTSCINGGKASLFRDGFLVKILDSVSPQIVSASGFPKENDIVVLATSDFFKEISLSDIIESFSKGLEATEDIFSMKLHSVPTASVSIIRFVKNNGEEASVDQFVSEDAVLHTTSKKRKFGFTLKISGISERLKGILPGRKIYLHRQSTEMLPIKSKKTVFVGIILTVLLGVSVFFGVYKNKKEIYINSYADTLNSAKANIEDAVKLKSVEIGRSRELFIKGRDLLVKLEKDGIKDPEINRLSDLVSQNSSDILGEKKVATDLWLDLTLVVDGFSSEEIVTDGKTVYIPFFAKNIIVAVDISSKKSSTIKIPAEAGTAAALTVKPDSIFVLGSDGIYLVLKKQRVIDKTWGESNYISAYASNIYILDSQKGEILKSSGTETGFSEGKKWTTSEKEDFSGVRSFAVDGFAWVLKSDSKVWKYSYGNKIKFEFKDYPYTLPDYDRLYTNEDSENLYLLDKESKTISVFNKDGEYKYNLISDIVSVAEDLVVSESEGSALLLTGGKLYEIKI